MPTLDLIVRDANLPDGRRSIDIAVRDGKVEEVAPAIEGEAEREIDATGCLVTAPFVESHFHLDSTLSVGQPRMNESGTLLEGIRLWSELKPSLTVESVKERARELCHWAIARGTLAIRSHVDVCEERLVGVQALLELRQELAPYLDIQLVAFPQDGYFRFPNAPELVGRALDLGVDVVGGIPHFERTMKEGTASVRTLCELAAERGLRVDMHCDETDDPLSRHVETLANETLRLGLEGRVTGSHLTSMHSMDNYYASKLISLIAEAGLSTVPNPLINIVLQGRHDTYPKRRGMTRVKELMAAGVNVSFGHDCVMDPWYSLGTHDMLEVASMGLHVAQMTALDEMPKMFDAVTVNGAETLGLDGYGLQEGSNADFVILQAADKIEALRTKAARLFVIRRGQVIAETARVRSLLHLGDREQEVTFRAP
ncbi:MAG: amidohydrolase family protein [bacterium]|nr:amidohydrolase family protein [bacterium]